MSVKFTVLTKVMQRKKEAVRRRDSKIKDLGVELSSAWDAVQFGNLQIQVQESH